MLLQFPERYYQTDAGVTSLSFSLKRPNLLAVNLKEKFRFEKLILRVRSAYSMVIYAYSISTKTILLQSLTPSLNHEINECHIAIVSLVATFTNISVLFGK